MLFLDKLVLRCHACVRTVDGRLATGGAVAEFPGGWRFADDFWFPSGCEQELQVEDGVHIPLIFLYQRCWGELSHAVRQGGERVSPASFPARLSQNELKSSHPALRFCSAGVEGGEIMVGRSV